MKRLILVAAVAVIGFSACQNADTNKTDSTEKALSPEEKTDALKDTSNYTTIEWIDKTEQDLGKVKEGTVVEVSYRFKNTGNHNLVVADVTAGCGCTTPDKPEEPIMPGQEGVIKAKFNSQGRVGPNNKQVYVRANTSPQQTVLNFNVEVTK